MVKSEINIGDKVQIVCQGIDTYLKYGTVISPYSTSWDVLLDGEQETRRYFTDSLVIIHSLEEQVQEDTSGALHQWLRGDRWEF